MSSIKPKLLYQLAVSFLYSAAPVIVFPYISRVLGPEHIGRINFIDYTAQFFILFATFGIPLYGVREVAKQRQTRTGLKELVSELLFLHLLTSFLCTLAFLAFAVVKWQTFPETTLWLLAALNIFLNAFSMEWLLQGNEDFAFYGKRSYFIKLLSVAAIFLLIRQASDYINYYFILILSNLIIIVIDIIYAFRKQAIVSFSLKLKKHIAPLTVFFLTSVTISLYTYFDTIILGLVAGSLAVGFYTTGLKIIRLTQNLVNDLGGVLLPRISFLIHSGDTNEINRVINKSLAYVLTISLPLGWFLYLAAPEIILLLAGNKFISSIPVLRILSVLPLFIGLSNLFGMQILLPFGKETKVLFAAIAGSIISIVANLIFCRIWKENGAATASIIAECLVTLIMGIFATQLVTIKLSYKFLLSLCFSIALFYPIVLVSRMWFTNHLILLMVAGICSLLVYMLLQWLVFRNPIIQDLARFVLHHLVKSKVNV